MIHRSVNTVSTERVTARRGDGLIEQSVTQATLKRVRSDGARVYRTQAR